MGIKYFLFPFVVWTISQTLKVGYRLFVRKEKYSPKHILWIYQYGDGAPSTHSAVMVSVLYILGIQRGIDIIFCFALSMTFVVMYNLVEKRKRHLILESYLLKSSDPFLRALPEEGKMRDISGHSYFEIAVGVVTGIILGYLAIAYYF